MKKIVFIVVTSAYANDNNSHQEFIATPELDKLIEEGWDIKGIENVTPPASNSKSIIRIMLSKGR